MKDTSVAIVGAGIVGLAHAWSAAERGCRVTVFERTRRASGASIRNFGMVWPIGQPAGESYQTALVSRRRWLKLESLAKIWVNPCGSLHLAHQDDEWDVLNEFTRQAPELGIECRLIEADHVARYTPAANPGGLRGALFSPTELCVNPPEAVRALPEFLSRTFGVRFQFETAVNRVETESADPPRVVLTTADGRRQTFDRVLICGGAELQQLFPEILMNSGLKLCKLQMMSVRSYETGWRIGPHLASGLTLRHYDIFRCCSSLEILKRRVAEQTPELDRFGIHVMASQNNHGEVILGDSHEYDDEIEPFDQSLIDRLILRELQKIITLPDWTIARHWNGIYAKYPAGAVLERNPSPGIHLITGTGGSGMTMSFGLAERFWSRSETT